MFTQFPCEEEPPSSRREREKAGLDRFEMPSLWKEIRTENKTGHSRQEFSLKSFEILIA